MNAHSLWEHCQIKLEMQRMQLTNEIRRPTNLEEAAEIDWAQQQRIQEQLRRVERAQHRMHNGQFGRCIQCGGPIHPERLLAYPMYEHCIVCEATVSRHQFQNRRWAA